MQYRRGWGGEDILVTHRDRRLPRNDTAGVGKHAGEPRREETQFPTLRRHQNVIAEFGPFRFSRWLG
ncbi:hypothetical protein CEXT_606331 [Caerostris extrusa]|uniref:Uncharacterized protein n=1 Tax=Caerostris extrusa TaxID=172846 RepID=A0AAV4SJS5_CAEEX|nr:hypothetical protein CEXT_606331 [Caerostris extrusa]